jgi:2-amino-4-hydroxy-6-hydroxymethyldihydropteridine diphosphokinase
VKAIAELSKIGEIIKKSSIYETEAWGNRNQSNFFNAIIKFDSSLSPRALLKSIKNIEKLIGRTQTIHWGPREIDIDIIFCQHYIYNDSDLKIPHPQYAARRFILEPLLEIDENFVHSKGKKTIYDILTLCKDRSGIHKLDLIW